MCTSLIIWHIVDGHTAGVIVFTFVFIFVEFYFILAFPRFIIIALLSIVTQGSGKQNLPSLKSTNNWLVLILGYELQVRKVGVTVSILASSTGRRSLPNHPQVSTSNLQPYYRIELLAPYRLACVSGGMLVAFVWTFFPYPLTARSQLRKDLGASLYLLANFYSIVHTTVNLRFQEQEGDVTRKGSPGRKLEKVRSEVYAKQLVLSAGLREHLNFTAWEPSFGGKFPKKKYDAIIKDTTK